MSLTDSSLTATRTELLNFLWRQWSQLGVAGDVAFQDSWLMDIEALLLFTLSMGRSDPRLLDEVLDWCVANADTISILRLKRLRPTDPQSPTRRALSAVASLLEEKTGSARWRVLQQENYLDTAQPYFLESDGSPVPLFGASDPHFLRAGLLRSPVCLRELSVPPSIELPVALILKLRALFGIDPRAEAIAYLLTHPVVGARELALATAYAPATAHTLLKTLQAGQFLVGSGREGYALEQSRWQPFLLGSLGQPIPRWIAWSVVLPTIMDALDTLSVPNQESSYLRSSRWLRIDSALCQVLKGSGLPNPFAIPMGLEKIEQELPQRLYCLATSLSRRVNPCL